jgi:hypothetical protein
MEYGRFYLIKRRALHILSFIIERNFKMSMNLHLSATINATIQVGKKKEKKRLTDSFDFYQTPTQVTRRILKSSNIKQAYIDWIKETPNETYEPIYEKYSDMIDGINPIGHKKVDYNDGHIQELNGWLEQHEGWEIEFYEM